MLVLCSDTDDVHYTDENAHWRNDCDEAWVGGVKMLVLCSDRGGEGWKPHCEGGAAAAEGITHPQVFVRVATS